MGSLAEKWKFSRRHTLAWGAAIVSVLALGYELVLFMRPTASIHSPRYLVAKRRLLKGNSISFLDLTTIIDEKSEGSAISDALTDQDLPLIKGALLKTMLAPGDKLRLSDLELSPSVAGLGGTVPPGLRAYAIHPQVSLNLRRGDRIDVLLIPHDVEPIASVLLEDISVLDVGYRDEQFEVIVAVAGREIQILEKAQQKGKLSIALRNPHEATAARNSPGRRLLAPRAKKKKGIEIISEMEAR